VEGDPMTDTEQQAWREWAAEAGKRASRHVNGVAWTLGMEWPESFQRSHPGMTPREIMEMYESCRLELRPMPSGLIELTAYQPMREST
jgi:hypothetical protein